MKRSKIIYSNYDMDTGESIVIIQNQYGTFCGMAKCHPDDEKYKSRLSGLRIAELRAYQAYYNYRSKDSDMKLLVDYIMSEIDDTVTDKQLRGNIEKYINEAEMWRERASACKQFSINIETEKRKGIDKFNKKKEKAEVGAEARRKITEALINAQKSMDKKE
jgi:hypothetical protein